MSYEVARQLPIFLDANGVPLQNGYIYIGTANQNPETNPVAIYWDSALTIPALQPVRTVGGYAMRNGSPAQIFTAAAFSLTVKTASNVLVYSLPSVNVLSYDTIAAIQTNKADKGLATASGLTINTSKLLGRTTALTGAVEEITAGANLTLTGGVLAATVPALASVQGAFKNLSASTSGTNATITVAADELVVGDGAGTYKTLRTVALSINSAGIGANGLDTGTLAASTWYSVWAIHNPTSVTTAGLISISATAPTMPTGYTLKARVGWIRTDGTANKFPLSFTQSGRRVQYKVVAGSNVAALPQMIVGIQGSITTPTWVAASTTNFVPSTAGAIDCIIHTGGASAMAAPNNAYGAITSTTNPPPLAISSAGSTTSVGKVMALESANLYYASDNANSLMMCGGWEDNI